MKKSAILLSFIASVFCFSCTATVQGNVTPSASPSSSASVSPSDMPSASPSSSVEPGTSATPVASPSSSIIPVPSVCGATNLVIGQTYDPSVFANFCVTGVKVGTKYVYEYTTYGTSGEVSTEITGIQGNTYTVHTKGPNFDKTTTSTSLGYQGDSSGTTFTYQGTESVTVPAGTYSAAKFTGSTTSNGTTINFTYWMAQGAGAVKVTSETNAPYVGTITTTVSLKSLTL